MAFLKSYSDYQPKGEALFVCSESPTACRYIKQSNWKTLSTSMSIGILFWISFILIFFKNTNFLWSTVLGQLPGGWFFIFWILLIILANVFWRRSAHDHVFYDNVAKIYRGGSKIRYRWILSDDIESMEKESVRYMGENFFVITVRFKSLEPKFLGRPSNIKFEIDNDSGLTNLTYWTQQRGIPLRESIANVV